MQLATDACTLFFLGFNQSSGKLLKLAISLMQEGFRHLLRGNIADHSDDQWRATVICVEKRHADLAPHLRTILAEKALLHCVAGPQSTEQLVKQNLFDLLVVGDRQLNATQSQKLFSRITDHLAKSGIHLQNAALHAFERDANRCLSE